MSEQDLNGVRDLLVAASKAEEMGFSATQRALSNMVLCGVCPFEKTCSTLTCMLLNVRDAPATSHAVSAVGQGVADRAPVHCKQLKSQIDGQVAFAQDGGQPLPDPHHASAL